MKRITIMLTITLFLVVGGNSNFNESGAVGNTAIFNKEYEKSEEIFSLGEKEKNFIEEDKTKQDQQSDTISESKAISLVKDMFNFQ